MKKNRGIKKKRRQGSGTRAMPFEENERQFNLDNWI